MGPGMQQGYDPYQPQQPAPMAPGPRPGATAECDHATAELQVPSLLMALSASATVDSAAACSAHVHRAPSVTI